MKFCIAAAVVPIALLLGASTHVIAADTLRLCVKPEGQGALDRAGRNV